MTGQHRFLPEKVFEARNEAGVRYVVIGGVAATLRTGYDELAVAVARYELEGGVIAPVASLADVIRSKRAAGRPKDLDALPVLEARRIDRLPGS